MVLKYIYLTVRENKQCISPHDISSSEVLELRNVLSMGEEKSLGGVVGAHLIVFLESCLCEAELCYSTVQVNHPDDRDEAEPEDLVAKTGSLGGLKLSQVQLAGKGWSLRGQLVHCLAVHLLLCFFIL